MLSGERLGATHQRDIGDAHDSVKPLESWNTIWITVASTRVGWPELSESSECKLGVCNIRYETCACENEYNFVCEFTMCGSARARFFPRLCKSTCAWVRRRKLA